MKKYYALIRNTIGHDLTAVIKLFDTRKECEKHAYLFGYQVTSNSWLGTVYSKRNGTYYDEARIVEFFLEEKEKNQKIIITLGDKTLAEVKLDDTGE